MNGSPNIQRNQACPQRELDSRLDLATRAARIGLWDWQIETGETYFNDSFYTILGYEPGELPMTLETWKQVAHPDDLPRAMEDLEAYLQGHATSYVNEHRLRRKDGTWMWVRDTGEVIERRQDGSPLRMVGVHVDIDDSKRLSKGLEALAQVRATADEHTTFCRLAQAIVESFSLTFAGVARVYHEGDELMARMIGGWHEGCAIEPFAYSLSGTPCAEVYRDSYCYISGNVQQVFPQDRMLADMNASSYVGVRLHDSKERPIGLLMVAHTDQLPRSLADETTIRVFSDRAASELERIDIEKGLRGARREAEAASVAKTEFLANMSHEIRTPMTAILGYAELLLSEATSYDTPAERLQALDAIHRNGIHLLNVINDILDMAKIEAGKMTVERIPTNPGRIVEEVVSLLETRAQQKGLMLILRISENLPQTIQSDPTRLRQILFNLVGNAIKFTSEGVVSVHADWDPEQAHIRFQIADTGIGMTDAQLSSIRRFDPFSQADSSTTRMFGGTGLGLRISNVFAEMLGGRIEMESSYGAGSRFTVYIGAGATTLPATFSPAVTVDSKQDAARQHVSGRGVPGLAHTRILLAEDGPDNQRLIGHILKKAGAEVVLVENGQDAVHAVARESLSANSFHAIVLDMQMPVLDGYSAAQQIRAAGYGRPIIALTAHAMPGDREKCLEAGCDDYVSKPLDRDQLLQVLGRHLDRFRSPTPVTSFS
jgi:PAS domain S-box-containing protein